mgnify:CR=1 FL=1
MYDKTFRGNLMFIVVLCPDRVLVSRTGRDSVTSRTTTTWKPTSCVLPRYYMLLLLLLLRVEGGKQGPKMATWAVTRHATQAKMVGVYEEMDKLQREYWR